MNRIGRLYEHVLRGMAVLAGVLMAAMMVTICIDVLLRNLGYQSSAHLFTFSEYALLLVPCLGAPWLVREKGHVYVEIVLMYMSPGHRRRMVRLIGVICILVCVILAGYGTDVTLKSFLRNDMDVRSFDMPRWMLVGFIPLSFGMMAIEFLRFLLRGENFLGSMASQEVRDLE
ncbi:MAG: TRAP transporter small permease [Betaproteobacteria bacterium]|nr:TRAP transporter small permease [Betaproteobacteria bacterium]